jgi:cytochrome c oxidase subunit 2
MSRPVSLVILLLLAPSFAIGVSATVHAADAAAGKTAYAICLACHGPDGMGNVALNSPKIAGQEAWYLKRQLQAYKTGMRGTAPGDTYGMQMRPMAMTVADGAAMDNLIAYIQTMPGKTPPASVTGDAAAGKASYMVCAACHGQQGEGVEALSGPKLVGQHDWYLVRQIKAYQTGLRGYHAQDVYGNQMKPMAAVLTSDQAINNVAAYLNSLQPE